MSIFWGVGGALTSRHPWGWGSLGYIPKNNSEHPDLHHRWRRAVQSGKLTPEQIQEAEALTAAHAASLAQSMDPPPEACAPPDPLDAFAEEAANRLEQDLLMASSGMRTKQVMRRIRRYKKFFDEPALQENELVLQYKAQMVSHRNELVPPSISETPT